MADTRTNDDVTSVRTRSPAEPKDTSVETVTVHKKVITTKPKATRQRMSETDKLPKSYFGKMKPGRNGGCLSKKTGTALDKTEKKPPGRPPGASKVEEKFVKKKSCVDKKPAASGQVDVKRTLNLLVEKVDKQHKLSAHKRVCAYNCILQLMTSSHQILGRRLDLSLYLIMSVPFVFGK